MRSHALFKFCVHPSESPRSTISAGSLSVCALLVGCSINIHIHFPEKELEDAADQIVEEVRPTIAVNDVDSESREFEPPILDQPVAPEESEEEVRVAPDQERSVWVSWILGRRAHAQAATEKIKINISSPKITKIKLSLRKRFPKLVPHYKSGKIGEGFDGFVALRAKKLGLKEKRDLTKLLAAENIDRRNLYTAIAVENEIDKKDIGKVGEVFSRSWQKKCLPGWWIEPVKGKWEKKKKKKKKDSSVRAETQA